MIILAILYNWLEEYMLKGQGREKEKEGRKEGGKEENKAGRLK